MRLFKLINAAGEQMTLSGPDGLFLYPDGLGFEFETDYSKVEYDFVETEERVKQKIITGTIVFITEARYLAFLLFITNKPLQLGYSQAAADYKYISCKVSRLKKIEITKRREWCRADIDFECYGQWQKSLTAVEAEVETDPGKTYPYTYPYTYSRGEAGSVTLNNTGDLPAPLVLKIRGPAVNPAWVCQQNGVFVANGSVGIELTAGEMLVVDARIEHMSINLMDLDGNLLLNVWQQSDMSKENYIKAPVGESEIIFSQETGTPDATVEMVELVYSV